MSIVGRFSYVSSAKSRCNFTTRLHPYCLLNNSLEFAIVFLVNMTASYNACFGEFLFFFLGICLDTACGY